MVRGKFTLISIKSFGNWPGKELEFSAVYDKSIPENQKYAEATPSGNIRMTVNNPPALEQLVLGKDYYVDFTLVDGAGTYEAKK